MAAKNKFLNAMKMPSIDDMFSSEADRQRESGDLVTEVPLSELHPFVGHPFEVRDDEDMQKLVDSIRENGVLTNLTVRLRAEGGYEIISGHRRFHAAQRAGLDRVKVQVRDIDDDQAIIDMVDSNIQREHISPMEKARAYAMRLDAAQRKRGRPSKENYSQVGNNFGTRTSSDELAEKVGESKNQIFRYVRLNSLVPDLQKKVDDGSLKFNPAVELSYLAFTVLPTGELQTVVMKDARIPEETPHEDTPSNTPQPTPGSTPAPTPAQASAPTATPTPMPVIPQTGDVFPFALLSAAVFGSIVGFGILAYKRRKSKMDESEH